MTLHSQLKNAKSEEDVKDAYTKALLPAVFPACKGKSNLS
jgi:hypothetical protein